MKGGDEKDELGVHGGLGYVLCLGVEIIEREQLVDIPVPENSICIGIEGVEEASDALHATDCLNTAECGWLS